MGYIGEGKEKTVNSDFRRLMVSTFALQMTSDLVVWSFCRRCRTVGALSTSAMYLEHMEGCSASSF